MRNSITRFLIAAIVASGVVSANTGCRTAGGWSMPSLGWPSWGKETPPASSISGTHGTPKPPSISVPPYQDHSNEGGPGGDYAGSMASTAQNGPYQASSPAASDGSVASTATGGGYYTGQYATGGGNAVASTGGPQQGLPSRDTPPGYTADARSKAPTGYAGWDVGQAASSDGAGNLASRPASQSSIYGGSSAVPATPSYGTTGRASAAGYGVTSNGPYASPTSADSYASGSATGAATASPSGYSPASGYGANALPMDRYGSAGSQAGSGQSTSPPTTGYGAASPNPYGAASTNNMPSVGYEQEDSSSMNGADYSSTTDGYRPGSTNRSNSLLPNRDASQQTGTESDWSSPASYSSSTYSSSNQRGYDSDATAYPSTAPAGGYPSTDNSGYSSPSTRTATPPYSPTYNR